jgi:hypothetical protein
MCQTTRKTVVITAVLILRSLLSYNSCEKYDMCFIITSEALIQLVPSANSLHFTALNVADPEYRFVSEEDI